jgi:signal transduction histidine kinase/CheY-like chemotaxis protein
VDPVDDEELLLRSVAFQNAKSILLARQRAERELVQAKEALERKTEELAHTLSVMRATLEATTDAILVTDKDAKVTAFNERYMQMWNMPREVLDSREHARLLEVVCAQFQEPLRIRARIDEIYASFPPESYDILELADGRVFERFSRILVVNDRNAGRVWSFRDVTAQRRTEQSLRDETNVLELLNRTGSALVSKLDLQALVQAVTDAGTQLSGAKFGGFFYTATDPDYPGFAPYTFSGAPQEAFEKFGDPRAAPLFGPAFRGESSIRCDDALSDPRYGKMVPLGAMPGSDLPIRSYLGVPVVSRSGDVIGVLFFGHPEPRMFNERTERIMVGIAAQAAVAIDNARLYDISQKAAEERKTLLESERAARTRAERMSEMKEEFLATLSHELRTPLSAILGWAQVLCRVGRDPADVQKGLEAIERNARVQTRLIEDLLDMSRITSGKIRLDIQPLQPISFIEAAVETVRPAAEAKGINLEQLLDPVTGPVHGDPNRLQQVVWNLLSNAIKFTPKDGKVQVVLERVSSHVEISVSDTGVGIRPEFIPHVFERFRQGDASTTRKFGGLGLGLAIVKQLVELHGGTVHAESGGEGRGATFSVHLPVMVVRHHAHAVARLRPKTETAHALDFQSSDLSGVKVVVVDDEADARGLIKRVLEDCGAEVLAASTAGEALQLVEQQRPHLLVSDIGMPEMDGFELLRRVRALGPDRGGKIPAIALTAFARSEDRTRALHAGFLVHVSKPVEPAELIATVASVAGRAGNSS